MEFGKVTVCYSTASVVDAVREKLTVLASISLLAILISAWVTWRYTAGMTLAIEMVQDKASKTPYPWQERRGLKVFEHALSRGALLRPLGSVVYFLPPYVITPEQIDFLAEVASEGIDLATRDSLSVAVPSNFHPDFRDPG